MALRPFEATKKLCQKSGWSLSDLELQKHLYLAQLEFMSRYEGRLINSQFEAWDLGPVIPEIYHAVKRFGARPIENIFHSIPDTTKIYDRYLYESYEKYKDKTPGQLVALTHRKGGAWDRNYKSGVYGIVIPDSDIALESRRLAA